MAADHAADNIRVNAVGPGPIYTPFHEKRNQAIGRTFEQYRDDAAKGTLLRRHGTPDEVAACILFLASDDASYVTGTLLFVDGRYAAGWTRRAASASQGERRSELDYVKLDQGPAV